MSGMMMKEADDDFKPKKQKMSSSGSLNSVVESQGKLASDPVAGCSKSADEKKKMVPVVSPEAALDTQEDQENRVPMTRLLGDGISTSDLDKLRQKGICTVEAVAFASTRQLCKINGISEKKATKLISLAQGLVPTGFSTASVLFEKRADVIHLTTGSANLDQLLGGGFETGSLTEIFGENRAGKTQLCMTMAVTCQLPVDNGGGEGKCLFIDTEGTFRPEKLVPIAERFGLAPTQVLENVVYAKSFNTEHQSSLLVMAAAMMSETRYALIIVDSSTALFRTDYSGRGELYDRQAHLAAFLRQLRRICDEYGVAAIYTNQVVSDCSGLSALIGNANKAVGGNIMGHASTTRLSLRKGRGETRICKVYSSPTIPESEAEFVITSGGINDPSD